MIVVAGCAIIILPILFGTGVLAFMNRKKAGAAVNMAEAYLCGFICNIGIFAVGHLAGVFTDKSVVFAGKITIGLLSIAAILSMAGILAGYHKKQFVCKLSIKGEKFKAGNVTAGSMLPVTLFAVFAFLEIYLICTMSVLQIPGDIMLETVNSFMASDGIYKVSPLTGKPYSGPPLRYEILCLPTMYTLLCRWFHMMPEVLVNRVIPVVIMCVSYLAYYQLGKVLFGKEKDAFEKRMWFLVIVAAVFLLCEGSVYMEGYGILHAGHLSTTWRNSILVPFAISAVLEKKWWQAVLCILAELCIAWTLWGLGICVAAAVGMLMIGLFNKFMKKNGRIPPLQEKGEKSL